MPVLRGGLIGCGFFARNHIHAWQVVEGAQIVAVCDANAGQAANFAQDFEVPAVYADAALMLQTQQLDFVDIVTGPASHRALVELAASHAVPVICQKPLAPTLDDARAITAACREASVPFMVHENFRWQTPMRALKVASEDIGDLFFGRICFRSAFDLYKTQPYLATDSRFILYDLGVHLLDLARFFLGEVSRLTCLTQRVNPNIMGEDVATVLLQMQSGATCVVEISYSSQLEAELFPQTLLHLEGAQGSAMLGANYQLTVVTPNGVTHQDVSPGLYPWSSSPGQAIQESVVTIQRHWVECLRTGQEPETSGADNLRTLELVFGAYESAESGLPYLPQNS